MKTPRTISWSFAEGRFFDLWMVVHFLTGVTGGLSNVHFELTIPWLVAIGVGMMILWEGLEILAGVRESAENRLIDVFVGVAGIGVALGLAALLTPDAERLAFLIVLGLNVAGGVLGWLASRRRNR